MRPGDPAGELLHSDSGADPDAVLDGPEVLDATVAGVPFREAVRLAYDRLISGGTEVQTPR